MLFDTFDRTGSAEFPFPKQVVFRALCAAVNEIGGLNIENRDDLASRLDIKTGVSAFSWGEKVSVSVTANGSDLAAVSVQSGAKTVFGSGTSHGKNRKNVREILTHTSQLLQQHGAAWREEMGLTSQNHSTDQPLPSVADELLKLAALRDQGILSPEEFNQQKARLLNGQ
jgi:hypothetical protein